MCLLFDVSKNAGISKENFKGFYKRVIKQLSEGSNKCKVTGVE